MDDLIKTLRGTVPKDSGYAETANAAADEIERLRAVINDNFDRLRELDRYRERYDMLREALIDALGPHDDTLISLAVAPLQPQQ